MNLDWCKESPLNLAREEILAESLAAKGAVKRHPLLTGVYFRESPDLASSKTGSKLRQSPRRQDRRSFPPMYQCRHRPKTYTRKNPACAACWLVLWLSKRPFNDRCQTVQRPPCRSGTSGQHRHSRMDASLRAHGVVVTRRTIQRRNIITSDAALPNHTAPARPRRRAATTTTWSLARLMAQKLLLMRPPESG